MTNATAVYEFRYSENEYTKDDIINFLTGIAKAYVFQLEQGDSGYRHFQGRLSLIKKRRKHEALSLFTVPPEFFEPTATVNMTKDAFYQMKIDTRVAGPYKDTDEQKKLTHQLRLYNKLTQYQWQDRLQEMATEFDMRTIDLIYDPNGHEGKSIFCEHLEFIGIAEEIPPYRLMDDIFQWVYCRPKKKCYLIDMPRGMKKDKLGDFYSGIEVIKNGVAFDKRNFAKKERFDRPRIYVFTNMLPCFKLMSADRWKIWTISPEKELIPYAFDS